MPKYIRREEKVRGYADRLDFFNHMAVHPEASDLIRQAISLLQEVDARHGDYCKRLTSRLATGRVGLNQRNQLCPRYDQIRLVEKFALARSLGDQLEARGGKVFFISSKRLYGSES